MKASAGSDGTSQSSVIASRQGSGSRWGTNGPRSAPRASAWSRTAGGPRRARSAAVGSAASAPSVPMPQRSKASPRSGSGSRRPRARGARNASSAPGGTTWSGAATRAARRARVRVPPMPTRTGSPIAAPAAISRSPMRRSSPKSGASPPRSRQRLPGSTTSTRGEVAHAASRSAPAATALGHGVLHARDEIGDARRGLGRAHAGARPARCRFRGDRDDRPDRRAPERRDGAPAERGVLPDQRRGGEARRPRRTRSAAGQRGRGHPRPPCVATRTRGAAAIRAGPSASSAVHTSGTPAPGARVRDRISRASVASPASKPGPPGAQWTRPRDERHRDRGEAPGHAAGAGDEEPDPRALGRPLQAHEHRRAECGRASRAADPPDRSRPARIRPPGRGCPRRATPWEAGRRSGPRGDGPAGPRPSRPPPDRARPWHRRAPPSRRARWRPRGRSEAPACARRCAGPPAP